MPSPLASLPPRPTPGLVAIKGTYTTNFSPAIVTGQIKDEGTPVSGASVSTKAGHSTTTDGSGNYTIPLNAPGIYTLTAQSGPNNGTDTVEAFAGTSAVLNLAIGPPPTPTPIPGLTNLGLFLLAGLFLAAIFIVLRRRPRLGIAAGSLALISSVALLTPWPEASAVTGPGYNGLSYTERGTLDIPTPGGIEVNTFTDNLVIQRTLFATPGKGLLVHPYLTYNSDHRLISSPFGAGWNFSYNIRYTKDSSGNVFIVWGDGRTDAFTTIGGGAFSSPPGLYMVLSEPVAGELLLRTKGGIEFHFTDSGHRKLTSIQDPNGNTLTLTYDAGDRLTTITDASGRTHTLTYDANGRLSQLTETALGRSYLLAYDASGRLTGLTDPIGNAETFAYDAENLLTTTTDKRGNTATVTYITPPWDADTRLPSNVAKGGSTTGLAFNNASDTTTATDSLSNDWKYAYDGSGRVTSLTDPALAAIAYTWDSNNNLTGLTDRNGNISSWSYDGIGNVLSSTDPLANSATFTYDLTFSRMLTATDRKGNITTFTYDANGNLTQSTDPLSNTILRTFDGAGQMTATTDRNGNTTNLTYDANGNVATITDPLSNLTQFAYDAASRLTQVTDANSDVTAYAYDGLDRLTVVTDALSNADSRTYDANSNLTVYADRRGNNWNTTYDALDRVASRTNPLSNTWSYAYDANSNLVTHTDAKTQMTTNTYDALNQLTGETFADTTTAAFTYDPVSNLLTALDANSSYTYVYDSLDRKTQYTDNLLVKSVLYAYDPVGRLTSKTGPEGDVVTYAYDVANRPTSLTEGAGTTTFLHDANGNMTHNFPPNGAASIISYDANNRVAFVNNNAPIPAQDFFYARDANGWVTQTQRLSLEIIAFTGDALGRITQESGGLVSDSTDYTRDYTYDANGHQTRLVSTTTSGVADTTLTIDAANRAVTETLAGSGTKTHAYGANGSRTTTTFPSSTVHTFGYDAQNRLVSSNDGFATTLEYTYDVMDNMILWHHPFLDDVRTMYGSSHPVADYNIPFGGGGALGEATTYTEVSPPFGDEPLNVTREQEFSGHWTSCERDDHCTVFMVWNKRWETWDEVPGSHRAQPVDTWGADKTVTLIQPGEGIVFTPSLPDSDAARLGLFASDSKIVKPRPWYVEPDFENFVPLSYTTPTMEDWTTVFFPDGGIEGLSSSIHSITTDGSTYHLFMGGLEEPNTIFMGTDDIGEADMNRTFHPADGEKRADDSSATSLARGELMAPIHLGRTKESNDKTNVYTTLLDPKTGGEFLSLGRGGASRPAANKSWKASLGNAVEIEDLPTVPVTRLPRNHVWLRVEDSARTSRVIHYLAAAPFDKARISELYWPTNIP